MNYAEFKQNLISLGFAEESDYEEFEDLGYTYTAINQATAEINTLFPCLATYDLEVDNSEEGYLYVKMPDIDKGFLAFADPMVLVAKNEKTETGYAEVSYYKPFGAYKIENTDTIVLDASDVHGNTNDNNLYWTFRIFYEKQPTQIGPGTADDFVFELPLRVHHLIPLLASYYLWLDDEPSKAAQYYNLYEQARNLVISKDNKPSARVEMSEWGDI